VFLFLGEEKVRAPVKHEHVRVPLSKSASFSPYGIGGTCTRSKDTRNRVHQKFWAGNHWFILTESGLGSFVPYVTIGDVGQTTWSSPKAPQSRTDMRRQLGTRIPKGRQTDILVPAGLQNGTEGTIDQGMLSRNVSRQQGSGLNQPQEIHLREDRMRFGFVTTSRTSSTSKAKPVREPLNRLDQLPLIAKVLPTRLGEAQRA
jgi:hypothetical protein